MAWAASPEALQQAVDGSPPPKLANPAGSFEEVDEQLEQNKQAISSLKDDSARSVMADFLKRMRSGTDPVLNAGAVLATTSETCGREFNGKTQEDSALFYVTATAFLAAGIPSLREECEIVWESRRQCLRCQDSAVKEVAEYTLTCPLAGQKKVVDADGLLSTAIKDHTETVEDFRCEKCCYCDESKQAEQEERACECTSCKAKKTGKADSKCECNICSQRADVTITRTMKKLPRMLAVKFDRVDPDWKNYGRKLINKVNLPLKMISLQESGSSTAFDYRLEGTVKHKGVDSKAGHYVSYWRLDNAADQKSASWILIDDDEVKHCSFQDADGQKRGQAYLMFFRRGGSLPGVSADVKTETCTPPAKENGSPRLTTRRLRASVGPKRPYRRAVDDLDMAVEDECRKQIAKPWSPDVANGFPARRIRRRHSCPPSQ